MSTNSAPIRTLRSELHIGRSLSRDYSSSSNENNSNFDSVRFLQGLSLTEKSPTNSPTVVRRKFSPSTYYGQVDLDHLFDNQPTQTTMKPYVTTANKPKTNMQPYVNAKQMQQQQALQQKIQQKQQQQLKLQAQQQQQKQQYKPTMTSNNNSAKLPASMKRMESHRLPKLTNASKPFQKMIAPTSHLHDELTKSDAYNHAMKCGIIWQSLVGQFVKFPLLWYDGEEPSRPYMGCPTKSNKWSFFGRHRTTLNPGDSNNYLRRLIPDENSSGKLVLHIVATDSDSYEPTEDLVVGVFHPNSKGIAPISSDDETVGQLFSDQLLNDCRDVWIGHRSRIVPVNGRRNATRIESLLHYSNKRSVDKSPLGPKNNQGIPSQVDNINMDGIFGHGPPKATIFVPENKLHRLLEQTSSSAPLKSSQRRTAASTTPASITLMKAFIGSFAMMEEV